MMRSGLASCSPSVGNHSLISIGNWLSDSYFSSTKSKDTQAPYTEWYSICILPSHIFSDGKPSKQHEDIQDNANPINRLRCIV